MQQTYLLVAALLVVLVCAAHSIVGEILIFQRLRNGSLVPAKKAPPLGEYHIRILWATWHLGTVFGLAFAAVLLHLGLENRDYSLQTTVLWATTAAFFGGAVLVLVGTRGRHPGWIGLGAVAVLVGLAAGSA